MAEKEFSDLKAVFLNCSIKKNKAESHTQILINKSAKIMEDQGVDVEHIYMLDHTVAFGMVRDGKEIGLDDDWPMIQKKINDANILVVGSPIWLGVKSSVATLAIERLYAHSSDRNEKGQWLYYGKAGGCIITGNEDGIKHCAMDILYALQHIGFMIPPQADCGWIGEAGPGPSYGDTEWNGEKFDVPVGFDNNFTNRNVTFMSWNLMYTARLLKDAGGLPDFGNKASEWDHSSDKKSENPEYR